MNATGAEEVENGRVNDCVSHSFGEPQLPEAVGGSEMLANGRLVRRRWCKLRRHELLTMKRPECQTIWEKSAVVSMEFFWAIAGSKD